MKKNININIFGQLFNIDEDAYQLLNLYLERTKQHFRTHEGGEEIAEDIERHVAELLWEHSNNGTRPINIEDINLIVRQIGNPSEIDDIQQEKKEKQESPDNTQTNQQGSQDQGQQESFAQNHEENITQAWKRYVNTLYKRMKGRKLYRNPRNTMISGVCSGLYAFTDVGSVTLWRLFFFFGTIILGSCSWLFLLPIIYLALSIILPIPVSAEDWLRMEGIPITPEHINEHILKESMTELHCANKNQKSKFGCLTNLLKIILIIILLPLVLGLGFFLLLIIFIMIAVYKGVIHSILPFGIIQNNAPMLDFVHAFTQHPYLGLIAFLCLFLLVLIPLWSLLSHFSTPVGKKKSFLRIFMLLLWLCCLVGMFLSIGSWIARIKKSRMEVRVEKVREKEQSEQHKIEAYMKLIQDSTLRDTTFVDTTFVYDTDDDQDEWDLDDMLEEGIKESPDTVITAYHFYRDANDKIQYHKRINIRKSRPS